MQRLDSISQCIGYSGGIDRKLEGDEDLNSPISIPLSFTPMLRTGRRSGKGVRLGLKRKTWVQERNMTKDQGPTGMASDWNQASVFGSNRELVLRFVVPNCIKKGMKD